MKRSDVKLEQLRDNLNKNITSEISLVYSTEGAEGLLRMNQERISNLRMLRAEIMQSIPDVHQARLSDLEYLLREIDKLLDSFADEKT